VKVAPAIPVVAPTAVSTVDSSALLAAWPKIVSEVSSVSKPAWVLVSQLQPISFESEVLTLEFGSQAEVEAFKNSRGAPDTLRGAIRTVLGVEVKFKPAIAAPKVIAPAEPVDSEPLVAAAVVELPAAVEVEPVAEVPEASEGLEIPESQAPAAKQNLVHEGATFGEAVLRDVLGATPVEKKK
jgi:hypothetical protein